MDYLINLNKITLANGYSIDFEHSIQETLIVDNVIVILIKARNNEIYNQNIFAITSSGDFLWRIGDTKLFYDGPDCPYVGMMVNEQDELVLFNWCDTGLAVNSQTGEIKRKWITK